MASKIARAIDGLNELIGRLVSWLTPAMVAVSLSVVVLRYVFGVGWVGLQELAVYLFAAVVVLSIAHTLREDGHVRIDVFYREWPPRIRAWIDLAGTLLFLLPVTGFLFWVSWDYVTASWSIREGSRQAGGLPGLFLIKSLIPLSAALCFLQGLTHIAHSIVILGKHRLSSRQQ